MSLTDKLNEVLKKDIINLRDIKRLKEREIKALFIFISEIITTIKSELDLKIKDLELRIKVLEDARKET